ncbi:unnamed protein product [Gadus morhua 'NCC']|jgi:hypothetical protein
MDSINHESGSIQPALSESSPPDHCVYFSPPLVLTNSPADRDDEGRNTEELCVDVNKCVDVNNGTLHSRRAPPSLLRNKSKLGVIADSSVEAGKQGKKKRKEKRK